METNKKGYMNNLGSSYKEFKKANPDVNITELGYNTLKRPDAKSKKAQPMRAQPMRARPPQMESMGKKKGGEVKKSTGSFRTSANGIVKKGKTKAKQVKMAKGGGMC